MQSKDWKEIPGYGGRYYVSKTGEIYSEYLKRKMKPFNRGNGYLTVRLSADGKVKNIMEAARDLGLSGSQIAKHLKGRFTNVKGHKFERV